MVYWVYNISMKKYFCLLVFLAFCSGSLLANTLNVLIVRKAARADLAFEQNYAIVTGDHHFYGPISKTNKLLIESAGTGLKLTLHNPKTDSKKSLGVFKGKVEIVRSLGAVNFQAVQSVKNLSKRAVPAGGLNLGKEAGSTTPFVSINQKSYGGAIVYNGPITAYAKGGVNLVETVELEQYVTHVVNCELGNETSLNALKAQSVMVRSYALFTVQSRLNALRKGNKNWLYFQLFATPTDQAYNCRKRANGRELPSDLVKKAVKETRGQVVLKKQALAHVQYNTCAKGTAPKGVICQEKMVKLSKQGKSYKDVLSHFMPGTYVGHFDARHLSAQVAWRIRQDLLADK